MKLHSLNITQAFLAIISEVDEFKGTWKALGQLAPEQLSSLKKVATIESVGSSTRIEGSRLTDQQVEELLSNISIRQFSSRDEQEVAGYSEVMNTIFQHYADIPLSENYIRQFHRDLLRYSEKDVRHRGEYKFQNNNVEAFDHEGNSLGVVFETATPFETPHRMTRLVEWTSQTLTDKSVHPLLVTAAFVVEFLAIHPFQDGNGRLSRILTTLLLLKAGYVYVPYSSLEAVIEASKEAYYLALRKTQSTLANEQPDWQPWVGFFLQALKQQKDRLEVKIEREKLLLTRLPALSLSILEIVKARGRATNSEIVTITNANRNTVKKHLENLVATNLLMKHGVNKGVWYSLPMG